MLIRKPMDTPIDKKIGVIIEGIPIEKERDEWIIGRLIYLSNKRLDIAYTVSMVSKFMHFTPTP